MKLSVTMLVAQQRMQKWGSQPPPGLKKVRDPVPLLPPPRFRRLCSRQLGSPLADEARIRPGDWLPSVLRASLSASTLLFRRREGRPAHRNKKLGYRRKTARRAALVNSCYVSRAVITFYDDDDDADDDERNLRRYPVCHADVQFVCMTSPDDDTSAAVPRDVDELTPHALSPAPHRPVTSLQATRSPRPREHPCPQYRKYITYRMHFRQMRT